MIDVYLFSSIFSRFKPHSCDFDDTNASLDFEATVYKETLQ